MSPKRVQTTDLENMTDAELAKLGAASRKEFVKLSEKDQILAAVKLNLETYGTLKPPDEVLLQAQVKTCSGCGKSGRVAQMFGLFTDPKGKVRAQSRCKECRASIDAHPTRHGLSRPARKPKAFTKTMFAKMNSDQRRRYMELWTEVDKAWTAES